MEIFIFCAVIRIKGERHVFLCFVLVCTIFDYLHVKSVQMRSFSWCTFSPVFSPSTEKQVPEKTPYLNTFGAVGFPSKCTEIIGNIFHFGSHKKRRSQEIGYSFFIA